MIFLPDDSPLNVDKDKVPDRSVMEALEVIRQAGSTITFSKNSLIENIKGAVRAANNKQWVEWVVIEATVISLGDEQNELANGDYIAIPAKRWQQRRKEIGL